MMEALKLGAACHLCKWCHFSISGAAEPSSHILCLEDAGGGGQAQKRLASGPQHYTPFATRVCNCLVIAALQLPSDRGQIGYCSSPAQPNYWV